MDAEDVAISLTLSACANRSELMLVSTGTWTPDSIVLGPVFSCRGGNLDFSEESQRICWVLRWHRLPKRAKRSQ